MPWTPQYSIISPNGAIFVGGPLDGRLIEFPDGFRPAYEAMEWPEDSIVPPLFSQLADHPSIDQMVRRVTYLPHQFACGEKKDNSVRDWILYVDDRMTLQDAIAKIFLSYVLRHTGDDSVRDILKSGMSDRK